MLAPAKLNLFLHVAPKRSDGYHDLFSLVAFVDIGDELMVESSAKSELIIDGPFADQLADVNHEDNIVWVAARRLLDLSENGATAANGLQIALTKRLPVASGIGGGSADAAATLTLVARHLKLDLNARELRKIGLALGADVPVCLFAAPAWMSGIGESLSSAPPLPEVHLVLVNPSCQVSTKTVFERFDAQSEDPAALVPKPLPSSFAGFEDFVAFLATVRNDLELPAKQIAPQIEDVLMALSQCGAGLARMSGSGATCFGLFPTKTDADACAGAIRLRHSDWWIDVGALLRE